jgi:hypothetical protein
MATTRIISMHMNKGKTIAQCLTDRTDYAKNPDKTDGGELISSYACDPKTADAEFLLSKRQYKTITGRTQENDVIAYQIRQSFKPGEVTPEEANRLGYELASRFLKGKHAFIVCTHQDKSHVHSHIIFNSTTIDCKHKFRDFLGSGKAVARLSDTICLEHRLSIIEAPKLGNNSYNKWLGDKAKPSHRELLRAAIDGALAKKPEDFETFLKLMKSTGYEVKRGAHIAFRSAGQKQNIRLRSLGEGYSEEGIRAVISGERIHAPRKKRITAAPEKANLLIDVQAKLDAGKGAGYAQWAKVFNLKQMAQTIIFLQEHKLTEYNELAAKTADATVRFNELSKQIKAAEKRMAEIAVLKTHIINYSKTRDVYSGYKAAGYSKKYLAEYESDIVIHKAAKKAFDELGMKKLPTVRSLQDEYAKLLTGKKSAYAEYRAARDEMKELLIHKNNIDHILGTDERKAEIVKGHERQ